MARALKTATPNAVSQWTRKRCLPAKRAIEISALLGVPPPASLEVPLVCRTCGFTGPDIQFKKDSRAKRGHVPCCLTCDRIRARSQYLRSGTWAKATPEQRARRASSAREWVCKNPEKAKIHRLRKYGITLSLVQSMYAAQSGKCAICGDPHPPWETVGSGLCVDHCHRTGRVRALLCGGCNRGLGKFRESPELLEKAAVYLRGFS